MLLLLRLWWGVGHWGEISEGGHSKIQKLLFCGLYKGDVEGYDVVVLWLCWLRLVFCACFLMFRDCFVPSPKWNFLGTGRVAEKVRCCKSISPKTVSELKMSFRGEIQVESE